MSRIRLSNKAFNFAETLKPIYKKLQEEKGYPDFKSALATEYAASSSQVVANLFKVTKPTIRKWLRKFDIPRKPKGGFHMKPAKTIMSDIPCKSCGGLDRYATRPKVCVVCERARTKNSYWKRKNG